MSLDISSLERIALDLGVPDPVVSWRPGDKTVLWLTFNPGARRIAILSSWKEAEAKAAITAVLSHERVLKM